MANSSNNIDSVFGYLTVVENGQESDTQRILFPAINNDIELSRENTYDITSTAVTPDGIHIYSNTAPLEIPIEFTLHYQSPLCEKGPQTLLLYAAQLHALLLPATKSDNLLKATDQYTRTEAATKVNNISTSVKSDSTQTNDPFLFPPACRLRLMSDGTKYKIQCHGFIKRVSVKFHAPYLQTQNSDANNLPSSATYSFTFVNCPSYTNNPKGGMSLGQSYGPEVWNSLYSTELLSGRSAGSSKAIDISRSSRSLTN